ncbi:hypothetical protein GCM10027062_15110 [Nocardioides hungaricus]
MSDWILAMASDPVVLQRSRARQASDGALAVLGMGPTTWGIEVSELVHADLARDEPEADRILSGGLEAAVLGLLVNLVAGGAVELPAEAIAAMRWDARQGTPLDVLLREVWRAHSRVQAHVIDAMASNVPEARLADEIRRVSAGIDRFIEVVIAELSSVIEQEGAAWGRQRAANVRRTVDEILDTGEAPPAADEVLGVPVPWNHLAAVLWPLPGTPYPGWSTESGRWTEEVREHLRARSILIVPRTDGSTDIIWSTPTAPREEATRSLAQVSPPEGFCVAFGFDAPGPAGFRVTLLSARGLARSSGSATRQRVLLADVHGALALMMHDREAAAIFVRRTLAGLDGNGHKDATLRATMLAFLEHQGSRVAAAEELHVAATTVAYRVRQAESLLQRPIATQRGSSVLAALSLAVHFPELLD